MSVGPAKTSRRLPASKDYEAVSVSARELGLATGPAKEGGRTGGTKAGGRTKDWEAVSQQGAEAGGGRAAKGDGQKERLAVEGEGGRGRRRCLNKERGCVCQPARRCLSEEGGGSQVDSITVSRPPCSTSRCFCLDPGADIQTCSCTSRACTTGSLAFRHGRLDSLCHGGPGV